MQPQAEYKTPEPINHAFTLIRDAVETQWFTLQTLSGESFRLFSHELARKLDDIEQVRFTRALPLEGEGLFQEVMKRMEERRR